MVTELLASLDSTVFTTALPTIVGQLHGVDQQQWVLTAYLLTSTIALPIYGKIGDLIGRKGLFLAAIGIFVVGSIISGFSGDMTWLVIGRAVQGLGGGGLMILSDTIVADVVPARQRGRAHCRLRRRRGTGHQDRPIQMAPDRRCRHRRDLAPSALH